MSTKLKLAESMSVATSSTAPLYSVAVTAALITPQLGSLWAGIVYIMVAIPSILVCKSMVDNHNLQPSKGSVYTWASSWVSSWLSGFALAASGIICTSGLGVYAAQTLLGDNAHPWVVVALSCVIIAAGMGLNVFSLRATTWVQNAGLIIQVVALGVVVYYALSGGYVVFTLDIPGFSALVEAVLLALFAFWGFDAVFALTEESQENVPARSAMLSIMMIAVFLILGAVFVSGFEDAGAYVHVALAISAITAVGSTSIPTVRGVEAMADQGDLPSWLSKRTPSSIAVCVLTLGWVILSALVEGFFWDSIEAVSIFVGFYFVVSAVSAWQKTSKKIHLYTAIIMLVPVVAVMWLMFDPDYGETRLYGIGGVGIIMVTLWVASGVLMGAAWFARAKKTV